MSRGASRPTSCCARRARASAPVSPTRTRRTACCLPEPFETRIARSYLAFKETFRKKISENDAPLAKVLKKTGDAFDRQFAEVRAGRISMFDLESLSSVLNGQCVDIERIWLDRNRWSK